MNEINLENKFQIEESFLNDYLNAYSIYQQFCAFFKIKEENFSSITEILEKDKHLKLIRIYTESVGEIRVYCVIRVDAQGIKKDSFFKSIASIMELIEEERYVVLYPESSEFYKSSEFIQKFKFTGIDAFRQFQNTEEKVAYYVLMPPPFYYDNKTYKIENELAGRVITMSGEGSTTRCMFVAKKGHYEEIEQQLRFNQPTRYGRLYVEHENAIHVVYIIINYAAGTDEIVLEMAQKLLPYIKNGVFTISNDTQTSLYVKNTKEAFEKSDVVGIDAFQKYFFAKWTSISVKEMPSWPSRMKYPYYIYIRHDEKGARPVIVVSESFSMGLKNKPKKE